MYQFEPNPQSTADARGSNTPLLAVSILAIIIEIISSLPTNLPRKNAFFCLLYDGKPSTNELKSPERYKCKITFSSLWLLLL